MERTNKYNKRWGYLHHCAKFSPAGTTESYVVLMVTDSPEEPSISERVYARKSPRNIIIHLSQN